MSIELGASLCFSYSLSDSLKISVKGYPPLFCLIKS